MEILQDNEKDALIIHSVFAVLCAFVLLTPVHPKIGIRMLALVIFAGSEQTLWMLPSWPAQNVHMIGHIAVYIIVPEILLGLAAYFAYQHVTQLSHWYKFPAAFSVMLFYLGSAAFFYFLIEIIII